jgi:hypothetical protein
MCSDIGVSAIKITVQILFFEESDEFSPLQRSIVFWPFFLPIQENRGHRVKPTKPPEKNRAIQLSFAEGAGLYRDRSKATAGGKVYTLCVHPLRLFGL